MLLSRSAPPKSSLVLLFSPGKTSGPGQPTQPNLALVRIQRTFSLVFKDLFTARGLQNERHDPATPAAARALLPSKSLWALQAPIRTATAFGAAG